MQQYLLSKILSRKGIGYVKIGIIMFIIVLLVLYSIYYIIGRNIGGIGVSPQNYTFSYRATPSSYFILHIYVNSTFGQPMEGVKATLSGYNLNLVNYTDSKGIVTFRIYYHSDPNVYTYQLEIQLSYNNGITTSAKNIVYEINDLG